MFTVEDALDLQALNAQRTVADQQIAAIMNKYSPNETTQLITDAKGRWIGLRTLEQKLELVPSEPPKADDPIDELLDQKDFAEQVANVPPPARKRRVRGN